VYIKRVSTQTLLVLIILQIKLIINKEKKFMKVKPLQDRVLVERLQEEEKTKGGLFIPDSAKEKPMQGKVVAAGNGRVMEDGKKIPMDVKVGDVVLFAKYSGNDVKIDDKEYLIMKEDDILAIVEK